MKIQLPSPENLALDTRIEIHGRTLALHSINTGVPHAVIYVDDLDSVAVKETGSKIRFHPQFQPAGTNVNFISHEKDNVINIRTYERGVEDETFACGTGSVAAALVSIAREKAESPVRVMTRSGEVLNVYAAEKEPPFKNVYLEGGAKVVCEGNILEEAYRV